MKRTLVTFMVLLLFASVTACANFEDQKRQTLGNQPDGRTEHIEETSDHETTKVATQDGNDIESFIPEGWNVLERIKGEPLRVDGDLNKDGLSDTAFVIEGVSVSDEAPPRALIIAFSDKNKKYNLSIKSEKAILKADEGGVWGDPLEGISIDRGSLLIRFYGGSNWRWYATYRFRFQENDWYLIGATLGSFHTSTNEYTAEEDFNLLTGEYIEKRADDKGNIKEVIEYRGKRKLIKLTDFEANSSQEF